MEIIAMTEQPIEPRYDDDERYTRTVVEPGERPTVSDLRPAPQPRAESSIPDNVRQPQDRRAAAQAQQAEANDENRVVRVHYNGIDFEFETDNLTFEFQLLAEQGRIATALQQLLGAEQFNKLLKWPLRHYQGLASAIGKAGGAGNS